MGAGGGHLSRGAQSASAVAARYAESLFQVAQAEGAVEQVRSEVDDLVRLVERAPALRTLLERPDVDADRKMAVLQAAFGEQLTRAVWGLLGVLIRHRRGDQLAAVAAGFQRLADEAAGVVRAEVRSAVPLAPEQRARLVAALNRITKGQVVLQERVDTSVLAGAVVQVGQRLIDGSAGGRLEHLRQRLMAREGKAA